MGDSSDGNKGCRQSGSLSIKYSAMLSRNQDSKLGEGCQVVGENKQFFHYEHRVSQRTTTDGSYSPLWANKDSSNQVKQTVHSLQQQLFKDNLAGTLCKNFEIFKISKEIQESY